MPSYTISEKNVVYNAVLYSDSKKLIASIVNKSEKYNLNIIIKNIKDKKISTKNEAFLLPSDNNVRPLLAIIDQSENNLSENELILFLRTKGRIFFIVNSKTTNIIKRLNIPGDKKFIVVEKLSSYEISRISEIIFLKMFSDKSEIIFIKNRRKVTKVKINKLLLVVGGLLLIFPYILYILLLLKQCFINDEVLENLPINHALNISRYDYEIEDMVSEMCYIYQKLPLIGKAYNIPYVFAYKNRNISSIRKEQIEIVDKKYRLLNNLIYEKNPQFGQPINYKSIGNFDDGNEFLKNASEFLGNHEDTNFVYVEQGGVGVNALGNDISLIKLYLLKQGALVLRDESTSTQLTKRFRGSIKEVNLLDGVSGKKLFDSVLNYNDEFRVLKIIYNELFGVKIDGMVIVSKTAINFITELKKELLNKKISYKEINNIVNKTQTLIDNNDLYLYYTSDNGSVSSEDVVTEPCYAYKIKLFKNSDQDLGGGLAKIKGYLEDGNVFVTLKYSVSEKGGLIGIEVPDSIHVQTNGNPNGLTYLYVGDNTYIISRLKDNGRNEMVTNLSIPLLNCRGFGVIFESPPVERKISLEYDFKTDLNYYLYLNSSLTGKGNKFYNTGLVSINNQLWFKFVN